MTYFGFLGLFVGIPILILLFVVWWDARRGRSLTPALRAFPPLLVLLGHILIALIYTTPWDNYLVATRVWWYDPELVTGIVIGWVPIEEYTFFMVQPILTGLWLFFLAKRDYFTAVSPSPNEKKARLLGLIIGSLIWVAATGIFVSQWQPGTYLSLELGWAMVPILFQIWFGGHLLWRYRRLLGWTIIPTTLYLSFADALAINSGTWTINPAQSLNWIIGGVLPFEELLFFLLTNTLLGFGMVLVLAVASQTRLQSLSVEWLNRKLVKNT
ncbi:MAG: lycopene cyclase domain-containing protein [Chloroflexota bacterium]